MAGPGPGGGETPLEMGHTSWRGQQIKGGFIGNRERRKKWILCLELNQSKFGPKATVCKLQMTD